MDRMEVVMHPAEPVSQPPRLPLPHQHQTAGGHSLSGQASSSGCPYLLRGEPQQPHLHSHQLLPGSYYHWAPYTPHRQVAHQQHHQLSLPHLHPHPVHQRLQPSVSLSHSQSLSQPPSQSRSHSASHPQPTHYPPQNCLSTQPQPNLHHNAPLSQNQQPQHQLPQPPQPPQLQQQDMSSVGRSGANGGGSSDGASTNPDPGDRTGDRSGDGASQAAPSQQAQQPPHSQHPQHPIFSPAFYDIPPPQAPSSWYGGPALTSNWPSAPYGVQPHTAAAPLPRPAALDTPFGGSGSSLAGTARNSSSAATHVGVGLGGPTPTQTQNHHSPQEQFVSSQFSFAFRHPSAIRFAQPPSPSSTAPTTHPAPGQSSQTGQPNPSSQQQSPGLFSSHSRIMNSVAPPPRIATLQPALSTPRSLQPSHGLTSSHAASSAAGSTATSSSGPRSGSGSPTSAAPANHPFVAPASDPDGSVPASDRSMVTGHGPSARLAPRPSLFGGLDLSVGGESNPANVAAVAAVVSAATSSDAETAMPGSRSPAPPGPERRRMYMARSRTSRASQSSDYDSDDEMAGFDEEERATYLEQMALGGTMGMPHPREFEEVRIRAQQLIRGQMPNKRVASKTALSQLQSVDMDSLEESERTCVICYNEFGVRNPEGINEMPLRLPNCKHVFGDHCIKKWFEESDSCPYCRDKVPSEPALPPNPTVLREFLRNTYNRSSQRGPAIMGSESAMRMVASDLEASPPRTWQTGERRSPPSEASENRRRTRARHGSFRGSPSAANVQTRPSGMAPAMALPHQMTTRERVNLPAYLGYPPWPSDRLQDSLTASPHRQSASASHRPYPVPGSYNRHAHPSADHMVLNPPSLGYQHLAHHHHLSDSMAYIAPGPSARPSAGTAPPPIRAAVSPYEGGAGVPFPGAPTAPEISDSSSSGGDTWMTTT